MVGCLYCIASINKGSLNVETALNDNFHCQENQVNACW